MRHTWDRYREYADLSRELNRIHAEEQKLTIEHNVLQQQVDWYHDPIHLEEKAKEELNVQQKGEKVIIVVNAPSSSPAIVPHVAEASPSWWSALISNVIPH